MAETYMLLLLEVASKDPYGSSRTGVSPRDSTLTGDAETQKALERMAKSRRWKNMLAKREPKYRFKREDGCLLVLLASQSRFGSGQRLQEMGNSKERR